MALIQSHKEPDKSLKQHVEEVEFATKAILNRHSPDVKAFISGYLDYVIKFHDLGKAISEFQKYISNPKSYTTNKRLKAHTPVSLILWLLYAQENNIPKEIILLVVSVVWKHHGDFPTFDAILNESLYEYEEDYKIFEYPVDQVRNELNVKISQPSGADEFDIQDLFDDQFLKNFKILEAAEYKIKGILLFSILLEADRTFLALSESHLKKRLTPPDLSKIKPGIVSDFLKKKAETGNQNPVLNQHRTALRNEIIKRSIALSNIESVSLPTGLGKTMIAAEWALKHRIQPNIKRKVLIVLPYLSIIDQTVKEYRRLFKHYGADELILEAHSIAERKYVDDSNENQSNKTNDSIDFLTDTWANDFIITTFDQFLYTLLSSKNSHLLRFHNLADALIIIDEIQALPSTLWAPFSLALNTLSKNINSKILIMSATQPNFLQTKELVPSPEKIFKNQNRYKILLKKTNQLTLKEFIDGCIKRIDEENWHQKRVLIVLNTRASARTILDFLENKINSDTFFLSADVTPKERLANIEKIKKNKPCLVIATQCIEAGVDIDMDFAIRDFAPLDSIVQCAGRCNRNGLKNRAEIEIISLINQKGKKYSDVVYDQTLLEKTAMVLNNKKVILEEDIFLVVTDYFKRIKDSKDTGTKNAEKWAYWDEKLNIKKLLRNDNDKYNFIVVSQDSPQTDEKPLRDSLLEALEIKDIWKKKRKIRSLQGRIAKLTISVWANGNILPEVIAEPMGCYYLLKDTYYIPGKGLNLKNLTGKSTCTFI